MIIDGCSLRSALVRFASIFVRLHCRFPGGDYTQYKDNRRGKAKKLCEFIEGAIHDKPVDSA
jgi:hypothetical protein